MPSFRLLHITNNISNYPECELDTLEFPELVKEVKDEMQLFVYCLETKGHWEASEFFYVEDIKFFKSQNVIKPHEFNSGVKFTCPTRMVGYTLQVVFDTLASVYRIMVVETSDVLAFPYEYLHEIGERFPYSIRVE